MDRLIPLTIFSISALFGLLGKCQKGSRCTNCSSNLHCRARRGEHAACVGGKCTSQQCLSNSHCKAKKGEHAVGFLYPGSITAPFAEVSQWQLQQPTMLRRLSLLQKSGKPQPTCHLKVRPPLMDLPHTSTFPNPCLGVQKWSLQKEA